MEGNGATDRFAPRPRAGGDPCLRAKSSESARLHLSPRVGPDASPGRIERRLGTARHLSIRRLRLLEMKVRVIEGQQSEPFG